MHAELREKVAVLIVERAIGVTWDMLHADRGAARKAQRSGTGIVDYDVHQDEVLDAADAILSTLRDALLSDEVVEAAGDAAGRELIDQELSGAFDDLGEDGSNRAIARQALSAALEKIGAPNVERR